jgi:hypothetical protein
MSTVTIDLNTNSDVKDLVADKQPGDKIDLRTSIKSLDGQTLVLTVEEATEGEDDDFLDDDEESEDVDDTDEEMIDEGKEMAPPPPPANRSNY